MDLKFSRHLRQPTQPNCLSIKQVSTGTSEVEGDDRIESSEELGPVGNDSGVGTEDSKKVSRARGRKERKTNRQFRMM